MKRKKMLPQTKMKNKEIQGLVVMRHDEDTLQKNKKKSKERKAGPGSGATSVVYFQKKRAHGRGGPRRDPLQYDPRNWLP